VTGRTAAIVPVHLYGQAADMAAIGAIASRHGLTIVEDCCQAHLATAGGAPVGTLGAAGAFSFYPTKNLGALGDGGAVVTNDPGLAERVRQLRNGGQTHRYVHTLPGVNSRLDELQAAVLRVRLPRLAALTEARRALAGEYRSHLPAAVPVPERDRGHVYHLFPIRSPRRDALQAALAAAGVETLIHYPIPLSRQPAFAYLGVRDHCVAADDAAGSLLSLPLHPRLRAGDVRRVAAAVQAFEEGQTTA
jgi:dTDP-4-amino-4,6-dideoxygalactose transaminase